MSLDRFTPTHLSPVPRADHSCALPYGLTWDDLRPCLPGFGCATGALAHLEYAQQGLHDPAASRILTLDYRDTAGHRRSRTIFVKRCDHWKAEAAKYRFLAAHKVPTPRLLQVLVQSDSEIIVLEFLPRIGIEPADADELLALIAVLNAIEAPPAELFAPRPGLPADQFDELVQAALVTLATDPSVPIPIEPAGWLQAYRRANTLVQAFPTQLNHGELYFQQVGRSGSGPGRQLVLFDLDTMATLPRYTDVAAILAGLSAKTGRAQRELFAGYRTALRTRRGDEGGGDQGGGDDQQAWTDMLLVRVATSFESLPWRTRMSYRPDLAGAVAAAIRCLHGDLTELGI